MSQCICKETLVTYVICTKTVIKICTLKFDSNRYTSLEQNIQEMAKSHRSNCYICKSCHEELQQKMTCVCCNRPMQKQICKMYNKEGYDFSYSVVSQCLQHLANSTHEVQYICISCDKTLQQTSDEKSTYTISCKICKCSLRSKVSEGTKSKT